MAPKQTRITVIYHLTGGENGEPLVLTDRAWSLDVPYSNSFMVQGCTTFKQGAEGVEAQRVMGLDWSSWTSLKGVIERASRGEGVIFFDKLMAHIEESVMNAAASTP